MIRSEIVTALSEKGYYKEQASEVIDDIFQIIRGALEKGDKVYIANFGTFEVKKKKGHLIQNPQTKQSMMTDDYMSITFSPCAGIKTTLKGLV